MPLNQLYLLQVSWICCKYCTLHICLQFLFHLHEVFCICCKYFVFVASISHLLQVPCTFVAISILFAPSILYLLQVLCICSKYLAHLLQFLFYLHQVFCTCLTYLTNVRVAGVRADTQLTFRYLQCTFNSRTALLLAEKSSTVKNALTGVLDQAALLFKARVLFCFGCGFCCCSSVLAVVENHHSQSDYL